MSSMKRIILICMAVLMVFSLAACKGKTVGSANAAPALAADYKGYIGDSSGGKPNGTGKITYPDGATYEGQWVDGQRSGHGVYIEANGDKFDGTWLNDKQNGMGIRTWSTGNCYKGEYKDGLKSGKGTMTWTDGRKYVGEYANDEKNGQGTYYNYEVKSPDRSILNLPEAVAAEDGALDIVLSGQFANGVPVNPSFDYSQCVGIEGITEDLTFSYSEEFVKKFKGVYTGSFVDGLPAGQGVFNYHIGGKSDDEDCSSRTVEYKGQFKEGLFNGQGAYKDEGYEEYDYYQGSFKNGTYDGYGKLSSGGC